MIPFIGPLIEIGSQIIGGVKDHFEGKRKLKQAELETKLRILETQSTHEMDWEKLWAQQAADSWKDEYWTIIISIPLILCFIPETVQFVDAGFAALNKTPEWYQGLVALAFGASFGVRIIPKGVNIVQSLLKGKENGK